MSEALAYLAADRRQALASGQSIADRVVGSALFADISGFSLLTDQLVSELGPRRGAEELTARINEVYDVLIEQVDRFGGSVISFSGDAITCWFDGTEAEQRAVTAALLMQEKMAQFAEFSLSMKIAIASGPARRFVVGDPKLQLIDVLAGTTLVRMSAGERKAQSGEILLDQATLDKVEAIVGSYRDEFAVLVGLSHLADPKPRPRDELNPQTLQPWIFPEIFARIQSGDDFLTELRPLASLFLGFEGIDYDNDDQAGSKLDAFIRWVERVAADYKGTLIDLTIGDKGSYLFIAFGIPISYEENVKRAAEAALILRKPPVELGFIAPPKIGISQGIARVGNYGSHLRRTYGALGNEINLSARLMQLARPGQILFSDRAFEGLETFAWQRLGEQKIKGRAEIVSVYSLLGQRRATLRLSEPTYSRPMIGRQAELKLIEEKLEQTQKNQGHIIGIVAEAGMGKSRLLAEAIKLAKQKGIQVLAGECQAYGTNTAYLVWQPILRSLFGLSELITAEQQIEQLENEIRGIDESMLDRLPLLGLPLGLDIKDSELTKSFDAKLRHDSLEALLIDLLRFYAGRNPLFFVLEDVHWIDSLSHDLLNAIGKAIADVAILITVAYRPPELARLQAPKVTTLSHYLELNLNELSENEAQSFILERLQAAELAENLAPKIAARAQGNPFFIEELIAYLQNSAQNSNDEELPDSLHSLILSRIDQLSEHEKITLKVASIIGRVFQVSWLSGYYPSLGNINKIQHDLEELRRLELTPINTPEPELSYIFKHVVTQEVAYQSIAYSLRATLHEQLADWLEAQNDSRYLDLLAYHYSHSENSQKKCEYLKKAGLAAQAAFDNFAALEHYGALLPLLNDAHERLEILLPMGAVFEVLGQWIEAEDHYQQALSIAKGLAEQRNVAKCEQAIGNLLWKRGDYDLALRWLEKALSDWQKNGDPVGIGQALAELGVVLWRKGEYMRAQLRLNESLLISRQLKDPKSEAFALNYLGAVAADRDSYESARSFFERSLALRQKISDVRGIAGSLNNLGVVALYQEDYLAAKDYFEQGLKAVERIGEKRIKGILLNNFGFINHQLGYIDKALDYYRNSLNLSYEIGYRHGLINTLVGVAACISIQNGRQNGIFLAVKIIAAAYALQISSKAVMEPFIKRQYDKTLIYSKDFLTPKEFDLAWNEGFSDKLEDLIEKISNYLNSSPNI